MFFPYVVSIKTSPKLRCQLASLPEPSARLPGLVGGDRHVLCRLEHSPELGTWMGVGEDVELFYETSLGYSNPHKEDVLQAVFHYLGIGFYDFFDLNLGVA